MVVISDIIIKTNKRSIIANAVYEQETWRVRKNEENFISYSCSRNVPALLRGLHENRG